MLYKYEKTLTDLHFKEKEAEAFAPLNPKINVSTLSYVSKTG